MGPCAKIWGGVEAWSPCPENLRELRAREKKLGIQPDQDLDGYLKATAMHGQRSNLITLLVMRLLGLEVHDSQAFQLSCQLSLHPSSRD